MSKVRWGVFGAARIAINKVLPAMQAGEWSEVLGIASRDAEKAARAAGTLGIPRSYASYEALLADPEIEAIYNPLPNQLHVPWTIRAAEAGKHVLCEKPIALHAAEAATLLAVRDRTGVHIQEAFMTRVNPQWLRVVEEVRSGRIGDLRSISVLSDHLPIVALVSRYPTNELIGRRPLPKRIAALMMGMNSSPHAVLATLSGSYPPLRGRSPTRYSAVRH